MKKLILLFLCTVLSVSLFAQQADIPKRANKILIKNNKTAAENFLFVKKILAERGVEIIGQDQDIKQVSTGLILFRSGSSFGMLIYCKPNEIQVVAKFSNEGVLGSTLSNRGILSNTFLEINTFVKHFGADLSYLVDSEIESRN